MDAESVEKLDCTCALGVNLGWGKAGGRKEEKKSVGLTQ